jgi:lipid-binding SYLF domain-containing protein
MIALALAAGCATAPATIGERDALVYSADAAVKTYSAIEPGFAAFLEQSYAYAVFPNVGKGGLIAGGAYGQGAVYLKGKHVGFADLTQVTVGAQIGGQSLTEVVVFRDVDTFNRFKSGKINFAANASAVALQKGAATTAKYNEGVAVFIEPVAGLMLEAAVGGQQLTYQQK